MAKIELSDIAPSEAVNFSIGNVEFKVPVDTDDQLTIRAAQSHPWLKVTPDKEEIISGTYRELSVQPKDDVLSAHNDISADPDEIKKIEDAKLEAEGHITAIQAGLDQTKVTETKGGDINLTIAADEADDPAEETTTKSASTSSTKKSEATK